MAQVETGARKILSLPAVYRLFTRLVGGPGARAEFLRVHARARPGDRVLDIGCGPGDLIAFLPEVDYVGYDASPEYVAAARKRYGDRGRFYCRKVGEPMPENESGFDLAIAFGVLHHLDDREAEQLFRDAREQLKPGGRLVTFDGCWGEGQSAAARWVVSRDRGQSVRRREELMALASPHLATVTAHIRHDLLRIPYTHIILECVRSEP